MKGRQPSQHQAHLFDVSLDLLIDPNDELVKLTHSMDWARYENELDQYYTDFGRPGKPIRLMVSLLLLKKMYDISDDQLVEQWRQNPYWQYFSGMDTFQWKGPCVSSELSHFRARIGEEGLEKILDGPVQISSE